MAGIVRTEFDVKAQKALQAFDNLTKKQQKVVVESSKMGKAFADNERKVKNFGKLGGNVFGGLKSRITASVDVLSLFAKGVQIANAELERTEQLNRKTFSIQGGVTAAIGSLIANTGYSKSQSAVVAKAAGKISGETGIDQAELINAVVTAVSGAGGANFTVPQILKALKESSLSGAVDRELDIGSLTAANLKLQATGFDEVEASNFAKIFVQQFGGKLDEAAKHFPKLLGTVAGVQEFERNKFGKAITKKEDIFALFGGFSQGPIPDIDQAATLTRSLFSRVNLSGFDFKTKGVLPRLGEIGEGALSGKIKDKDIISTFTKSGAKGSQALGGFAYISGGDKDLQRRRKGLFEADQMGSIALKQFDIFRSIPQVAEQLRASKAKAAGGVQKFRDVEKSERTSAIKEFEEVIESQGLGQGLFGTLNRWLVESGNQDPASLKRIGIAIQDDPWNEFLAFFTNKTKVELEAQESARELYEETVKEMKKSNKNFIDVLRDTDINRIITAPGNGQGDD